MNKTKSRFGMFSRARLVALVIITLAIAVFATATAFMKSNDRRYSENLSPSARKVNPANLRSLFLDPQEQEARRAARGPVEGQLRRAQPFDGDLRDLPYRKPVQKWRPEREPPDHVPQIHPEPATAAEAVTETQSSAPAPASPAPTPNHSFDGLDFATWGNGHPPDENGDVGPTYYIQTINTSVGIFNKNTGALVTAFTFDTFMSQGNFGNLCDTDNFGDPVIVYDTFEI